MYRWEGGFLVISMKSNHHVIVEGGYCWLHYYTCAIIRKLRLRDGHINNDKLADILYGAVIIVFVLTAATPV